MKLKQLALVGVMSSGMLGVASQAHALAIDPSYTPQWTTSQTSALSASDVMTLTGHNPMTMGALTSIYKQDYDFPSLEDGDGAPYYTTTFTLDSELEPTGASIVWDGPLWIACPTCYLVVKDGVGPPAAYVFNLGNWDGKQTITLSGFWEDAPGSISYVEIFNYGEGGATLVPEPETYAMLLAGLGLVGFAARRKIARTA